MAQQDSISAVMQSTKHRFSVPDGRQNTPVPGRVLLALILFFGVFTVPASAAPPELELPIDCTLGKDCWLVNFVDRDPGPGRADFRCGALSYDGHQGTDIALANLAEMARGVDVLAAADGVVLRVRDGMPPTRRLDEAGRAAIAGRDCGNGLVIDHGDGWSTQYCHMAAGSLVVSPQTQVQAGDRLGTVGLSGRTEFPHIHMTLRQGDTVIDPFTGDTQVAACDRDAPTTGYWSVSARAALNYPGPQPYHIGFADGRPDFEKVRAGAYAEVTYTPATGALVVWAEIFGVAENDVVRIDLTDPNGRVVAENSIAVERPRSQQTIFAGRRKSESGWPIGDYLGTVTVTRGAQTTTRRATLVVQ